MVMLRKIRPGDRFHLPGGRNFSVISFTNSSISIAFNNDALALLTKKRDYRLDENNQLFLNRTEGKTRLGFKGPVPVLTHKTYIAPETASTPLQNLWVAIQNLHFNPDMTDTAFETALNNIENLMMNIEEKNPVLSDDLDTIFKAIQDVRDGKKNYAGPILKVKALIEKIKSGHTSAADPSPNPHGA